METKPSELNRKATKKISYSVTKEENPRLQIEICNQSESDDDFVSTKNTEQGENRKHSNSRAFKAAQALSPGLVVSTPVKDIGKMGLELNKEHFYHETVSDDSHHVDYILKSDISCKALSPESFRHTTTMDKCDRQSKNIKRNILEERDKEKQGTGGITNREGDKHIENCTHSLFVPKDEHSPPTSDHTLSDDEKDNEWAEDIGCETIEFLIRKMIDDEVARTERRNANKIKRLARTASSQVTDFLESWVEGMFFITMNSNTLIIRLYIHQSIHRSR